MTSTCDENGIRVLKFGKLHGPVFKYEEPTNVSMGDQQHISDPLDRKYGYVNKSKINVAGDGLFAARDIPENTKLVLYGGHLYNKMQYDIWLHQLSEQIWSNWQSDPLKDDIELFPLDGDYEKYSQ